MGRGTLLARTPRRLPSRAAPREIEPTPEMLALWRARTPEVLAELAHTRLSLPAGDAARYLLVTTSPAYEHFPAYRSTLLDCLHDAADGLTTEPAVERVYDLGDEQQSTVRLGVRASVRIVSGKPAGVGTAQLERNLARIEKMHRAKRGAETTPGRYAVVLEGGISRWTVSRADDPEAAERTLGMALYCGFRAIALYDLDQPSLTPAQALVRVSAVNAAGEERSVEVTRL